MSSTTKRVLGIGYALVLALLAANGLLTYSNVRTIVESDRWVGHTREVLAELTRTLNLLVDAETGQRGYLLTGEEDYLTVYRSAAAQIDDSLDRLAALTADNRDQRPRIAELRLLTAEKLDELGLTVTLRDKEGPDAALEVVRTGRGKRAMDRARRVLADMAGEEDRLLELRTAWSRDAVQRTVASSAAGTALTVALLVVVYRLKRREDIENQRAAEAIRRSEEWLQTTLTSIGDAVIATDDRGFIRLLNPVAQGLTGWTQDEAQGKPLDEVFPIISETTRRAVESPVTRVLREGTVVGLANHTVLISRDGSETAIDDSAAPILDSGGRIVGVVMVFRDVGPKRRQEELVLRWQERYRALLTASAQIVWVTDPEGAVIEDSPSWRAFTGQSSDAWAGWSWLDPIHDADRERVRGVWLQAVADQSLFHTEYRLRRADGVYRWMEARGVPILTPKGRVREWVGMNTDVSDRKEADEALRQASAAAEHANRAKDQFLAVLSHELRTPLNPILLVTTALLERPAAPEEIRPTLEMIKQNVMLQSRLIDDLLDVMRIVRGKMNLIWEVADCHALIRHSVEICRSEFQGKVLHLTTDLMAEHSHIRADPARLQQVFWNLIRNAIKFTPERGTIAVRTRNEGDRGGDGAALVIEVSDSGIGIEPDLLPNIFDAFRQGETTISRKYGGLGLGLAISRGIVEAHGGALVAESEGRDRGATFRVMLPALPEPQGTTDVVPEGDEAPPPRSAEPCRILIVEDDPATLRLLERLLGGLGHRVRTAGTVAGALDVLRDGDFDLLISDIGLPDGTGLDLIRRVVAAKGAIPAIALTGYGMDEDIRRSREAGFAAHMTKPIDFTRLEAMIRQLTV